MCFGAANHWPWLRPDIFVYVFATDFVIVFASKVAAIQIMDIKSTSQVIIIFIYTNTQGDWMALIKLYLGWVGIIYTEICAVIRWLKTGKTQSHIPSTTILTVRFLVDNGNYHSVSYRFKELLTK